MNKKLLAMMSAMVMCFSAMPLQSVHAETDDNILNSDCAETYVDVMPKIPVDVQSVLPEWIPQNFTEALHFDNKYGKTHIEDGLICCVRKKYNRIDCNNYLTEYSGDDSMGLLTVFNETYNFVMPEKPDESDKEAYQEYLDFLSANYIYKSYIEYFERYNHEIDIKADFEYEVTVYAMNPTSSVEINWIEKHPQTDQIVNTTTLSFESSEDGEITETDLYGWFPDCLGECNFEQVSIVNGHIVFCDDVCYDGGLSLIFEQTGTAELECVASGDFYRTTVTPEPPGTSPTVVRAYKPLNSGTVKATFTQAQDWEGGYVGETVVKYYNVDDDGNITEISGVSAGDCNGDGQFTISDVVMFQRWLSGKGELTNWQNADFTWDNNLDIFDLVLMKQELLKTLPEINTEKNSVSADDITVLKKEIFARYPDTDMSDFTFKYKPDHPQSYNLNKVFSVYYNGLLVHGYGDFNYDSSVYASVNERTDGLREVKINLVQSPEDIMAVDTSVKCIERYEMKKLLDSEEYPELIIYVDYEDKPVLAYRLEDTNGYGENIYDAVTGEKIRYIPYLVCVLPMEDF